MGGSRRRTGGGEGGGEPAATGYSPSRFRFNYHAGPTLVDIKFLWDKDLKKYTVGLAQLLRKNDVGMTSWAVSRNGIARPNGLAKATSDTV
uniref:Uncharacterized protein n=1 Tax=Oryza sativa subsp. japonica TaxID=39947 RepID=Q7G2B9_ORYSJ|nr:hypothetical protein LOC_Os10g36130 [Oryza sativa Japonica Group]AAX95720.1 hypothetical protein [Oryza sativa Japonica Group]